MEMISRRGLKGTLYGWAKVVENCDLEMVDLSATASGFYFWENWTIKTSSQTRVLHKPRGSSWTSHLAPKTSGISSKAISAYLWSLQSRSIHVTSSSQEAEFTYFWNRSRQSMHLVLGLHLPACSSQKRTSSRLFVTREENQFQQFRKSLGSIGFYLVKTHDLDH